MSAWQPEVAGVIGDLEHFGPDGLAKESATGQFWAAFDIVHDLGKDEGEWKDGDWQGLITVSEK